MYPIVSSKIKQNGKQRRKDIMFSGRRKLPFAFEISLYSLNFMGEGGNLCLYRVKKRKSKLNRKN